ncbi:MAG TPA: helix-turn-helix transcriptional regulator [Puia sp.]|nr:helix-turn-helix transcriptional regulator [Puia sp.]
MKSNKPARKHSSAFVNQLLAETSDVEKAKINNRMTLATRLDDLITARRWSKSEFAAKVGKSPSEITKWLSGTQNFTIDTLTEISLAFNLSVGELFADPQPQIIDHIHLLIKPIKIESIFLNELVGKKNADSPSGALKGKDSALRFSLPRFSNAQS